MLHGLAEEAQVCSGYTYQINYEKEVMSLDSIKIHNQFPLDILIHSYFNSGYACGRGTTICSLLQFMW